MACTLTKIAYAPSSATSCVGAPVALYCTAMDLQAVFADIIEGRFVKRSVHDLRWESQDRSVDFIRALQEHGYVPTLVQDVAVAPGERAPAFVLADGTAYFGWVFWEKFTDTGMRKLFGSVVRNRKGDWARIIPSGSPSIIYAHPALRAEMDLDQPSSL